MAGLFISIVSADLLQNFEYRRVMLTGKLDERRSVLVGPKIFESTIGYHVFTPLVRHPEAPTIIVNRGFITADQVQQHLETSSTQQISLLGLLRKPPKSHWFTPKNVPEEGKWFWPDIQSISEHTIGRNTSHPHPVLPFWVDAIYEGDWVETKSRLAAGEPIGRPPSVELRNTHATYALIWCAF